MGAYPVVWKGSGTGPYPGDGENNHLPTLLKGVTMVDKKKPSAADLDESSEISLGKLFDAYVPDTVKRALFTGAGMLFMTEEGIRKTLSEFNLPREAVNYLIKQSERGKDEFFANLQREMHWFFSRIDATRLVKAVLNDLTVDVHATVTLRTKRPGEKPVEEATHDKAPSRKRKRSKG